MPPERHFVSEACIAHTTLDFARAEFALLAPFAPTSEPAPLVAVCLFFGHVVLLSSTKATGVAAIPRCLS